MANKTDFKINKKNLPWRPVLTYVIFGFLWILFSDRILGALVQDDVLYQQLQTFKGWMYVTITGILLYVLIYIENRYVYDLNREIHEKNEELLKYADEAAILEGELQDQLDQLNEMARTDSLTGLRNRKVFEEDIQSLIVLGKPFSIYYLDVDHFKNLNNIHGHYFGDLFLIKFSEMMDDVFVQLQLYRWGGDEFVVIDPVNKGEDVQKVVQRILKMTHRTWQLEDVEFHTSTSIGVVHCPEHGNDLSTIFKNLEIALYRAKENGRSRCEFFDLTFLESIEKKSNIEKAINEALQDGGFYMNYQPIYTLDTRKLKKVEALLRFNQAVDFNTHIGEVISVAELTGQIHRIDNYVIERVFSKMAILEKKIPNLEISINISAQTFVSEGFIPYLRTLIDQYKITPKLIEFEITEHTIVKNIDKTDYIMKRIKQLGFKIALDDFGTRYSSLNYLSRLPLDVLKIDKSYIDNILNEGKDIKIVKHIVSLAKSIGLETVAEGIEMVEQEEILKNIGCDYGQGYHYSRPQSLEKIIERFGQ